MPNQSEIARLRAQIQAEYEAAQSGLSGLAQGVSQHVFITTRMEHIGQYVEELRKKGGDALVEQLFDTLGRQQN